jgi:hypothetical protein
MLDIENLTVRELRQLQQVFSMQSTLHAGSTAVRHPYTIGQNYFIRTVTMHLTGRLVDVTDLELVLEDAAWIADSGRFATAMKTGVLDEVEPYPGGKTIVGRGAIVDAWAWPHGLPREQK